MKKSLNKVMIGAIASGIVTLFITAVSWSMPPGDGPGHDPEHMVTHLTKVLHLTEEQQASVQTLLATSSEETGVDAERLHTLRDEMRDQTAAFNAATAQTAADEIGQITSRMVYRMASTRAAIYQLLDDEQKVAMNELEEKRGERRDKGLGHHGLPF